MFPWRGLLLAALASALLGGVLARQLTNSSQRPAAATGAISTQHAPQTLPLTAQGPVSAAIGAGQARFDIRAAGGALVAHNRGQHLSARFTRAGATVSVGSLHESLSLLGVGYGGVLRRSARARPTASGNRVVYAHPGISEWYVNGPLGLEQGFTIARAPVGQAGAGALKLQMGLSGNASVASSRDGQRLLLTHASNHLSYGALVVSDATGRRLRSGFALTGGGLTIRVAARGARYPLRIDPLMQQGPKLTGKGQAGGSNLGQSVAISADGNTMLVGGPSDEAEGEMLVGAAWVFTRSGGTWTQQGPKLTGGGRVGEGQFGISVALSGDGNTALIGAINDANVGAAWVFTRSGGTWTQQGSKLTGGGEETGNGRFGKSVALSADGNTALVGGYFDNGDVGAAWAFKRAGGVWSQLGKKITATDEEGMAQFGLSVALSGDGSTALIGGPADEGPLKEPMTGAAWVFTHKGTSWSQQGPKLTAGAAKGAGELGTSVAISADGNTALVGAPADGDAGGARAFVRTGSSWAQQGGELEPSDATEGAGFGTAVSLSSTGNAALIGGPVDADGPMGMLGPNPSGAVWEFARSGAAWNQQGAKVVGTKDESEFGAAVAFSADALTAAIGGPIDSSGGVTDAGAVWVYVNPPPIETPIVGGAPGTKIVTTTPPKTLAPTRATVLLSKVSQSHTRWRAGSARARLSSFDAGAASGPRRPKAPLGTTFSFSLNVPAAVVFVFTQKLSGHRVHGKCVAPKPSNRHKPACKRTVSRGALSVRGHAGSNRLAFQGTVGRTKLKPGAYTVTIAVVGGGIGATAKSLGFTIVK
jgi:hypothetical protein